MNYRHIYHAGNFADVVKHATLALVIERLKLKDAAFRVIDTHAGIGTYELGAAQALKTGEWLSGIGRLVGSGAAPLPPPVAALLEPYLRVVRSLNPPGTLRRYPGSPRLARALLRPQDRLVANELHPEDGAALRAELGRDDQVRIMTLDGWTALKALLPPKERRGVILVDPPFEESGELERLVDGLRGAARRFATGVYLMWYPIKDVGQIRRFKRELAALQLPKLSVAELSIRPGRDPAVLSGTGLVILNPPYELDRQLALLLPALAERLAIDGRGSWTLTPITV